MARKYGKKATEKVARTMHEFKRGKLRSSHGGRVTSREQAIAIGVSQARRAGYKVPSLPGHAAMSLDARVRAHLSHMRPGTAIDARGIARALGGVDPLAADYALESAERAGLAVTSDGRWFGPAGGPVGHARKKTPPAQLNREIAAALSQSAPASIKLKDRYSGGHVYLTVRDGRVVGVMGSDPARYMGMTLDEARHHARYGGRGHGSPVHATRRLGARKMRAPRVTPYRIKLTPDELRALEFARGRYAWPDMLSAHAAEDGSVAFTESEMWQWTDDVDSDAEGGHAPFPLASDALVAKLQHFYDARI